MNQIIQSIVCFSDFVWMNCAARPSDRLPRENKERISGLLRELEASGKVKLWGYPHQKRAGVKIIEMQEYRKIAEKINETFLTERELLPTISYSFKPIGEEKGGIETTSKIISARKEYWSLAVADLLESDRVIVGPEYKTIWPERPQKFKYATAEGKMIEKVLKDFLHIPDLTGLTAQDIVRLQNLGKPLRRKIEEICAFDFKLDGKELEKAGIEFTDSIWDFFPKTDLKSLGKSVSEEAFYAVISVYIHPILSALPFGRRFLDWLNTRRKMGFAIFMSELKRTIRKRARD